MIKEGATAICDSMQVYVEEIDPVKKIAYVFDYENYNGGWVKLSELSEVRPVCIIGDNNE